MNKTCPQCQKEFPREEIGRGDDKKFIANYSMWEMDFCSQECMDKYERIEFVKWKEKHIQGE